MAQKVQILLTDDIDGGDADETIRFALDGQRYEIDLSGKNAKKMRDALAPFVGSARKVDGRGGSGSGSGGGRGRGRRRSDGDGGGRSGDTAAIRAWAREQGLQVNERGRIPGTVLEQYRAAH